MTLSYYLDFSACLIARVLKQSFSCVIFSPLSDEYLYVYIEPIDGKLQAKYVKSIIFGFFL